MDNNDGNQTTNSQKIPLIQAIALGYNKGDSYEEKILQICLAQGITPFDFKRGGAGNSSDIEFIHNGEVYVLEVKADTNADYGQKTLCWKNGQWNWCVDDEVTRMYTKLGLLQLLNDESFIPKRFTIEKELITMEDKNNDQRAFERKIDIDTKNLFLYYNLKNCHYIQIGGYGFYYLDRDILNLGVPQFNGRLRLRFRAKTIHSIPTWNYGFYAVLKIAIKPDPSPFDLEPIPGKKFPAIKP